VTAKSINRKGSQNDLDRCEKDRSQAQHGHQRYPPLEIQTTTRGFGKGENTARIGRLV